MWEGLGVWGGADLIVCVCVCVCVCVRVYNFFYLTLMAWRDSFRDQRCAFVPCLFARFVSVCVRARFFPFHTRKGALMLYILYVEPTMGHLGVPMKRCTRGWSSRMASTPGTLGVAH